MMKILTILLLPLFFIATSCDSGGEGTACAVNPSGFWKFTDFDIVFSNECVQTLDETVSDTILENLQCVTIGIIPGGGTSWDECECADDTREIEDCITYDTYTCSENIISNGDDLWLVEGNIATTGSTQSIEEFMLDFGLEGDPDDFGLECTVTILAELTRQ